MNRVQKDISSITDIKELFAPLDGRSIMITGATGLIGSMMTKVLCDAKLKYGLNIRIICQVRDLAKAEKMLGDLEIEFTEDFSTPCDFLIHTASPTSSKFFIEHPVETIRASVENTIKALEAAAKNGTNVVYLSSMEEYGVPYEAGQIMTEDKVGIVDHLNIRSCYPESKRLCECLCASYASEYGLNVKIARLAQTFGAGQPLTDGRLPMQLARSSKEGKDIVLHTEGKSISNFVYLSDAITGLLTIMLKGEAGQAYNVCNDKETRSVRSIAELVASEVSGGKIDVLIDIPEENMGYALDAALYLNSDKLRSLGWKAEVTMAEAYRRLIEYIRESDNQ